MIKYKIPHSLCFLCFVLILWFSIDSSSVRAADEQSSNNSSETKEDAPLRQQEKQFRWKFEPGKKYFWSSMFETNFTVPQGDAVVKAAGGSTLDFEILVLDRTGDQNLTKLKVSLVGVRAHSTIPEMEFDYDSSKKIDEAEQNEIYQLTAKMFSAIITEFKLECLVDARGVVKDVSYDKILMTKLETLPNSQSLTALLTAKGLNSLFYGGLIPFPEEPLQKGDFWGQSYFGQAGGLGTIKIEFIPRYAGPVKRENKQWEQFDVELKMHLLRSFQQLPVKIKKRTSTGVFYFDPQSQIVRSSEWELKFDLVLNDGAAKGQFNFKGNSRFGFAEERNKIKAKATEAENQK
ncbi:hypothetical protein [Gimesia algae]|uniref:Uncharacterized protein n=1 Tax=Gimesia algae TaxID=2527971 RepID=A0A517VLB5_9PLAN|nr:hypothetical protein [Gimesia algae]QDT93797.1 hypothetical protein Pan161_54820 [Gimesia algae]